LITEEKEKKKVPQDQAGERKTVGTYNQDERNRLFDVEK